MVDHLVNRKSDLRDDDHRLPLDDRHRMGYHGVDDLKLGVNLVVNRGLRMNDLLDDQSLVDDHRDVPVGRRMNGMDDRNDLMMVVNLLNRNCALRDLKTGASLGVNRGHRVNGLLDDLNLDVSRVNRNCARHDLTMVVSLDVSRGHRMSDRLDDQNLDVSRVNRNYVRHDRKMGENSDVKNLHVMYY